MKEEPAANLYYLHTCLHTCVHMFMGTPPHSHRERGMEGENSNQLSILIYLFLGIIFICFPVFVYFIFMPLP